MPWVQAQESLYVKFTRIDQTDGLSSPNIREIVLDPYGFAWFATQDGLNRYDGQNFIWFNSGEKELARRSRGSDFRDLVLDEKDKILWAIDAYGGLNKIDIQTCRILEIYPLHQLIKQPAPLWYRCISISNRQLFIGTQEGFIIQFDIASGKVIRSLNISAFTKKSIIVNKLYADEQGKLWTFVEGEGLLVFDSTLREVKISMQPATLMGNKPVGNLVFLDVVPFATEIIVATNHGILSLHRQTGRVVKDSRLLAIPSGFLFCETYGIYFFKNSLFISNQYGLFECKLDTRTHLQIKAAANVDDMPWLSAVYAIYAHDNTLWLGNQKGIALVNDLQSPYTGFRTSLDGSNVKLTHCYNLKAINDSVVFSCALDGLFRINTRSGVIQKLDGSQPYYQVFITPDGNIIASGEREMYVVKNNALVRASSVYRELGEIVDDFIIASRSYKDSILFLASQNNKGLYIWDFSHRKLNIINDSTRPIRLKSKVINSFVLDSSDKLLIVCDNVLSIYDFLKGKIEHRDLPHPQSGQPISILQDAAIINGHIFLAAYGVGIVELDKRLNVKSIVSSSDGIVNTGLYKIYPANDSILMASSNNGLYLYNIYSRKVKKIDQEDGLHSNNFDETSGSELNGVVYMGGPGGFTRIESRKVKANMQKPQIFFSGVQIKGDDYTKDTFNIRFNKISVPNDFTQVNIHFAAPYYSSQRKITYSYRLSPNTEWIEIAGQNFLTFSAVAPGDYVLYLRARNEDEVWSDTIETRIVFYPKWHQTPWFTLALIMAGLGIIYGIYRYRLSEIRREENIRKRISSDLHDDIGSTLNSVKVYANLALSQPEKEEHLIRVKQSTQEAITGLRDVIWVLDDRQDTIEQLAAKIGQFAKPLCEANGVSFIQQVDPDLYGKKLGKEEKRNIYLILKESINNSIKYSECTEIICSIGYESKHIHFTIRDNGKGFDLTRSSNGNGLRNIQYRAKQIGYKAFVKSAPGKGTFTSVSR